MTTARRVANGVAAVVVLVALLVGIPVALWHFVGWPLPHRLPSAAAVGRALDHQGIPTRALIDALAVVVWLAWASLLASVAVEIPAVLAGRHARRLPVAGVFQPAAGRLVAAVVVAAFSLAARPAAHPGPLAAGLPAPAGRPPAGVVLTATTLAPRAPGAPPPAPAAALPSTQATGRATAAATRTYVVERGDTLWGIAERELGDPLAWARIYQLNVGRPQPGGAALSDPHWIYAGWTLALPARTSVPPAVPAPSSPGAAPAPAPPVPSERIPAVPAHRVPAPAPPATSPATVAPAVPAHPNGQALAGPHQPAGHHPVGAPGGPVPLPSGSVLAGSFAAGVLSALAAGRLRRRHSYRYRPPRPGRDLSPVPARPTLAHLVNAVDEQRAATGAGPAAGRPPGPVTDQVATPPAHLALARRGGETISLPLAELSGLALCGPTAPDVARALVAGLVVAAGPGQVEVLLAGEAAGRLLPGAGHPALRREASADAAARILEAERIARTRRLAAAAAVDAEAFRRDNPENPLPVLLAVCDRPPAETAGRWAALAAAGPRLGLLVAYLGDTPAAAAQVVTDETRQVRSARPEPLAGRLAGAELFGLSAAEAAELLDALTAALADEPAIGVEPDGDVGIDADVTAGDGQPGRTVADGDAGEAWPEPVGAKTPGDRPVRAQLLGHLAVFVHGQAVADGLRSRAKMLLAWYLLRPEGATSEQAVDALWPDTAPDQVGRQFWRAFGDLRARLRHAGGDGLDVLVKAGDHYQPATAEITCDLWDFQAALKDAAHSADENTARAALRRVVETYRGELAEGCDWPWVEPVRADLHRRAVDAHLRLAELEVAAGRPDAAGAVLARAIDLDRYAEEPYRRLMTLQAESGRLDALRQTWQLLHRRLSELDLEIEPRTARLYHQLTDEPTAGLRR